MIFTCVTCVVMWVLILNVFARSLLRNLHFHDMVASASDPKLNVGPVQEICVSGCKNSAKVPCPLETMKVFQVTSDASKIQNHSSRICSYVEAVSMQITRDGRSSVNKSLTYTCKAPTLTWSTQAPQALPGPFYPELNPKLTSLQTSYPPPFPNVRP